jgi:hypothetical protein
MQTLRLPAVVLRDLRAIFSGFHPGRRPTPSPPAAAIWKGAPPLPNHPSPTLAVGLLSTARRGGMKGPPGLSNSPVPTSAVGSRPTGFCPQRDRCPPLGAGLQRAAPLRDPHSAGPNGASAVRQVCRWQAACAVLREPAPSVAQVLDTPHRQARRSATLRTASDTLSFVLRPQRCGARSVGQTALHPRADGGPCASARIVVLHARLPAVAE